MRAARDTVKTLATAGLAALVLALSASWRDARASDDSDSVQARGRALTHWLSTGQFDRVLDAMSPQLRATVGGHEGLARLVQARDAQAGEETALVDEAAYHERGLVALAPAAGRVTSVVDGVPDNTPGTMREDKPAGNHVVIDHGSGEHSLLAHLRRGSTTVKRGDTVERGERLGECGNSGRSSEPHVHYHLQTAPLFGEGEGLPAAFVDYFSGGEHRARGEPVRGEVIHRLPSTDSRAKR